MKENDNDFIKQVVDYYYSTIDGEHLQGNMSAVSEHFGITRAKVNKILITAGVIDSPLHQDIMMLKGEGYDTDDIALALGVSASTVKINMPYEKVIYNGEEKSVGAQYVDAFRGREKVFFNNVVRTKTDLEKEDELFYSDPENVAKLKKLEEEMAPYKKERTDDPIHLNPLYTEEERKLFKVMSYVVVLHIELDADLKEVKDLAEIKYGQTISRDILVPFNLPLHNLHYAINQAFGFTNSHLHEYTLTKKDLDWVTQKKVSRWKRLVGRVFKDPYRGEDLDYWDDDYEGGSPKKWMRSKYTGPKYKRVYEESYWPIHEAIKEKKFSEKTLEDLRFSFECNPLAVNETLSVCEIFAVDGHKQFSSIKEYDEYMEEALAEAANYPKDTVQSSPFMYAFADKLNYIYDFGDEWRFVITPHEDVEYLKGRVTASEMKEAIKSVLTLARPRVIAADGLPLIEDVGGAYGFMEFLQKVCRCEGYEEDLEWAKGNGWTGKIGNLKTLL